MPANCSPDIGTWSTNKAVFPEDMGSDVRAGLSLTSASAGCLLTRHNKTLTVRPWMAARLCLCLAKPVMANCNKWVDSHPTQQLPASDSHAWF